MKKSISILIMCGLLISLSACSSSDNSSTGDEQPTSAITTTYDNEQDTEKNENSGVTSSITHVVSNESSSTTDDETYEDVNYKEFAYIGDRQVQYQEEDEKYLILFSLKDSNNNYTSSSGVANITIVDGEKNTLFSKEINFDDSDFNDWTNQFRDNTRKMCGLFIERNEIEGGISNTGTLSLDVTLEDGTYFDTHTESIFNLPEKSLEIILPELPVHVNNESYKVTSYCEISEITYTSEIMYDNTASITMEWIVKLTGKTAEENESDRAAVGYKLLDSKGIIVDSGDILVGPLAVGETMKTDVRFFDLDPNEKYTLQLMDTKF
jgi:hypothetical protein